MASSHQISHGRVFRARVVEWSPELGYGWLQWDNQRLFLHRRDFTGQTPSPGLEVTFIVGKDSKGRMCAVKARPTITTATPQPRRSFMAGLLSLLVLLILLALPALAIKRYFGEHRLNFACYAVAISLITIIAYASDKRRAQRSDWRVSEAKLHLLEIMGGWPGAWLAQRYLRHKCSKRSYQVVFMVIILIYQYAAYDSLHRWRYTDFAVQTISHWSDHRLPTMDEFKAAFSSRWEQFLPRR